MSMQVHAGPDAGMRACIYEHKHHLLKLTLRAYSMYAKPLDLRVFLSEMILTSRTLPAVEKN